MKRRGRTHRSDGLAVQQPGTGRLDQNGLTQLPVRINGKFQHELPLNTPQKGGFRVFPYQLDRPFDPGQIGNVLGVAAIQWNRRLSIPKSLRVLRPRHGRQQIFQSRQRAPCDHRITRYGRFPCRVRNGTWLRRGFGLPDIGRLPRRLRRRLLDRSGGGRGSERGGIRQRRSCGDHRLFYRRRRQQRDRNGRREGLGLSDHSRPSCKEDSMEAARDQNKGDKRLGSQSHSDNPYTTPRPPEEQPARGCGGGRRRLDSAYAGHLGASTDSTDRARGVRPSASGHRRGFGKRNSELPEIDQRPG